MNATKPEMLKITRLVGNCAQTGNPKTHVLGRGNAKNGEEKGRAKAMQRKEQEKARQGQIRKGKEEVRQGHCKEMKGKGQGTRWMWMKGWMRGGEEKRRFGRKRVCFISETASFLGTPRLEWFSTTRKQKLGICVE